MDSFINVLNWLAVNIPWEALGTALALSGLLVGPQKLIKKWFEHNEQVMIIIVGVASMLVAAGHYLLTTPTADPTIIALQGAALAFMTQPFYFIIIKPLVRYITTTVAKARAFNEQVETALQPVAKPETETTPVVEVAPVTPVAESDVHAFDN